MSETPIYLVYAENGARLVYAGEDIEAYERTGRELSRDHAGELVSRRRVGPELWHVRAFFCERPEISFIDRRRSGFPFGLRWHDAAPRDAETASGS